MKKIIVTLCVLLILAPFLHAQSSHFGLYGGLNYNARGIYLNGSDALIGGSFGKTFADDNIFASLNFEGKNYYQYFDSAGMSSELKMSALKLMLSYHLKQPALLAGPTAGAIAGLGFSNERTYPSPAVILGCYCQVNLNLNKEGDNDPYIFLRSSFTYLLANKEGKGNHASFGASIELGLALRIRSSTRLY